MTAQHQLQTLDRVRQTARRAKFDRKGNRSLRNVGLALSAVVALSVGINVHAALGVALFASLASIIGVRYLRQSKDQPMVGIDAAISDKVLALPARLPDPVGWRLDRALHAVHHLSEMLEHAPFGGDLADATALREDAATCLAYVVERCEALADLYAVAGPSDAVLAARTTVQREIDEHLIELSGALDAAATYVAAGTTDAAEGLRLRAQQLHAIAGGLRELEGNALPPASTAALPPA